MMRAATISLALLTALAAAPAYAEITPSAGNYDARVRNITYNEANVVRIVGTPTTSTQLVFSPDEEIVFVAVGDADYWLTQPAGYLLFLKPTEVRPETNAQVVTRRRDGSMRSYQLALVASEKANGAAFSVVFNYPGDAQTKALIVKKLEERQAVQLAGIQKEITAQVALEGSHLQGARNWRYVSSGSKRIEPVEVFDNGSATSFRFPGNMRLPTIYTLSPSGDETLVSYAMHGDLAVVQTTAHEFRLRDGREVARVVNQAFDRIGVNPQTGTKTPEVQRTIRTPTSAQSDLPEWIKTAPRS